MIRLSNTRVEEWSEAVGQDKGSIYMESTPIGLWLVDKWLWIADEALHYIERRFPTDSRGWSWIDRLTPDYGNPICFAYLYRWGNWYRDRQRREVHIDVRLEQLSKRTQEWHVQFLKELSEPDR